MEKVLRESKIKNKNNQIIDVYKVLNTKGFILSDDFFEKKVYSKNLQNYKAIKNKYFAYNPARINFGSIELFKKSKDGIVSPMYIVFYISEKEKLLDEYLLLILKSEIYIKEIKRYSQSRGSVEKYFNLKIYVVLISPFPHFLNKKRLCM